MMFCEEMFFINVLMATSTNGGSGKFFKFTIPRLFFISHFCFFISRIIYTSGKEKNGHDDNGNSHSTPTICSKSSHEKFLTLQSKRGLQMKLCNPLHKKFATTPGSYCLLLYSAM